LRCPHNDRPAARLFPPPRGLVGSDGFSAIIERGIDDGRSPFLSYFGQQEAHLKHPGLNMTLGVCVVPSLSAPLILQILAGTIESLCGLRVADLNSLRRYPAPQQTTLVHKPNVMKLTRQINIGPDLNGKTAAD
jgi:hypothetical protein